MFTYRPDTKFNEMFNPLTETFTNIDKNKRGKQRVLFVIQIINKDVAENIVTTLYIVQAHVKQMKISK